MSRKSSYLLDYGIEEEIDPTIKFNSLISVTVSTIMCLAAKCPVPKSNVETTKLFLSTITDDSGKTPRNIKDFLSLLNDYTGPYEDDSSKERPFDNTPVEKLLPVKEKKPSLESVAALVPASQIPTKELNSGSQNHVLVKRNSRIAVKKSERDSVKKASRTVASKLMTSKSIISSKF